MAALAVWIGLGTFAADAFVEYSGYSRCPFLLSAGGAAQLRQIPRFPAPTGPAQALITHGALYDTERGPRHILSWPWLPPYSSAGPDASFPSLEVMIAWTTTVQHLLNASMIQQPEEGAPLERGIVVGTWNSRPLTASLRLKAFQGTLIALVALQKRAAAAAS
jgi:hypothetical protein